MSLRLLIAAAVVLASATASAQPSQPNWTTGEVIAWPGSISTSVLLRIGLRNTSDTARLVCITGRSVFSDPPGVSTGNFRRDDACRRLAEFELVLPGETTFIQASAELDYGDATATRLNAEVWLVHVPLSGASAAAIDDPSIREIDSIEWNGTVGEGYEAARRLSTPR